MSGIHDPLILPLGEQNFSTQENTEDSNGSLMGRRASFVSSISSTQIPRPHSSLASVSTRVPSSDESSPAGLDRAFTAKKGSVDKKTQDSGSQNSETISSISSIGRRISKIIRFYFCLPSIMKKQCNEHFKKEENADQIQEIWLHGQKSENSIVESLYAELNKGYLEKPLFSEEEIEKLAEKFIDKTFKKRMALYKESFSEKDYQNLKKRKNVFDAHRFHLKEASGSESSENLELLRKKLSIPAEELSFEELAKIPTTDENKEILCSSWKRIVTELFEKGSFETLCEEKLPRESLKQLYYADLYLHALQVMPAELQEEIQGLRDSLSLKVSEEKIGEKVWSQQDTAELLSIPPKQHLLRKALVARSHVNPIIDQAISSKCKGQREVFGIAQLLANEEDPFFDTLHEEIGKSLDRLSLSEKEKEETWSRENLQSLIIEKLEKVGIEDYLLNDTQVIRLRTIRIEKREEKERKAEALEALQRCFEEVHLLEKMTSQEAADRVKEIFKNVSLQDLPPAEIRHKFSSECEEIQILLWSHLLESCHSKDPFGKSYLQAKLCVNSLPEKIKLEVQRKIQILENAGGEESVRDLAQEFEDLYASLRKYDEQIREVERVQIKTSLPIPRMTLPLHEAPEELLKASLQKKQRLLREEEIKLRSIEEQEAQLTSFSQTDVRAGSKRKGKRSSKKERDAQAEARDLLAMQKEGILSTVQEYKASIRNIEEAIKNPGNHQSHESIVIEESVKDVRLLSPCQIRCLKRMFMSSKKSEGMSAALSTERKELPESVDKQEGVEKKKRRISDLDDQIEAHESVIEMMEAENIKDGLAELHQELGQYRQELEDLKKELEAKPSASVKKASLEKSAPSVSEKIDTAAIDAIFKAIEDINWKESSVKTLKMQRQKEKQEIEERIRNKVASIDFSQQPFLLLTGVPLSDETMPLMTDLWKKCVDDCTKQSEELFSGSALLIDGKESVEKSEQYQQQLVFLKVATDLIDGRMLPLVKEHLRGSIPDKEASFLQRDLEEMQRQFLKEEAESKKLPFLATMYPESDLTKGSDQESTSSLSPLETARLQLLSKALVLLSEGKEKSLSFSERETLRTFCDQVMNGRKEGREINRKLLPYIPKQIQESEFWGKDFFVQVGQKIPFILGIVGGFFGFSWAEKD